MIALITPTGARAEQFKLCQMFMERQTYRGDVIWIIVDDCLPLTTNSVGEGFKDKWTIIKVYPTPAWMPGDNTQGRNIQYGINVLFRNYKEKDIEAVFIIEDDDYYRPIYLESMMSRFGNFDTIGERNTIYYNVLFRGYVTNDNIKHASLFQIAFTPKVLPIFEQCYSQKFIDFVFFSLAKNVNLFNAGNLAIGIKGMRGRPGIGAGHVRAMYNSQNRLDLSMNWLHGQIGEDARLYEKYYNDIPIRTETMFHRHKL
jgi:hypothetical protein